jgi:AhpD family alkylhydroperoxidase
MRSIFRNSAAVAVIAVAGLASAPAMSNDVPQYHGVPNFLTFQDIQEHFGMVPAFFHLFPEAELAATWDEYKRVQRDPATALDAKTKHLSGLAVAAQADCAACIYFQTSAAFANGASFQEVQEAVAVFVIQDNWSKVLTADTFQTVKDDTNALMARGTLRAPAPPAVN